MMYLIINFLISILMVVFFYLSGNNFSKIFLKNKKEPQDNIINKRQLYVFLGIFWYGNILFLINFFIATRYIFFIFFILLIFLERDAIKNIYRDNKFTLFSMIFLVHSIVDNNPSQDANMYHFYLQNLISSQKIIFGLSNFDPLYGLASIFDYVASSFWIGNNYGYIQLLNLVVIASFFNFLYFNLISNKKIMTQFSLIIIVVGLLDNLGFDGGRNGFLFIQEIGKFDNVYSILFLISTVIFYVVITNNDRDSVNIYLLMYFVTFLSQIRSMGYLFFIFIIIYFYIRKFDVKPFSLFGLIFLNTAWLLKNFITTSCLVYPLNFTCVPYVDWYWPNQASHLSNIATSNNRNPNLESIDFFSLGWVSEYWIHENYSYLLNFFLTFFVIKLLISIFSKKTNITKNNYHYLLIFCIFTYLISWLLIYPNYRFVSGIVLSIYTILNLKNLIDFEFKNLNFKNISYIAVFFLIISNIFLVRVNSYTSFYSDLPSPENKEFLVTQPILLKRSDSFGYKSTNFYCYASEECSNSVQSVNKKVISTYFIYTPLNIQLYK